MVLSDISIRERLISGEGLSSNESIKALNSQKIIISPLPSEADIEKRLGQCSFDLTLGDTIFAPMSCITMYNDDQGNSSYVNRTVDLRKPESFRTDLATSTTFSLKGNDEYVLEPGSSVLAMTYEIVGIPSDLVGTIHSRSKIGRFFISSSYDAPKIDPGFWGQIVLEITNQGARRFSLHIGLAICQIMFMQLDKPTSKPYCISKTSSYPWQRQI